MPKLYDIISTGEYPSCALSNFAPHAFVFDDVPCASMEGLLNAFKFDQVHMQRQVCSNVGVVAHNRAKGRSKVWKKVQKLWWNGEEYDRHGPEYQVLLDRAYQALWDQSWDFRQALYDTYDWLLTHRIGGIDPKETILTQAEFCMRLMKLRQDILDYIFIQECLERHG